MQKAHLLCAASVKEGWGLTVTEANSQGTPAIVYDVDALRDAVRHSETGLVCQQNTPDNLAKNIVELIKNEEKYQNLRTNGWQWSKEINFERSYADFANALSQLGALNNYFPSRHFRDSSREAFLSPVALEKDEAKWQGGNPEIGISGGNEAIKK